MIWRSVSSFGLAAWAAVICGIASPPAAMAERIAIAAQDTVTPIELDHGDELRFTLRSGRTVSLILDETEAAIVEQVEPGGIIYRFGCHVRIDGQKLTLQRFVCAQECFYEPYVVDGLRIWPDTVRAVFDEVPVRYPREGNLRCRPRKAARFGVQDATLRVCPQPMHPWLDEPQNFLDVGRCYNGDDCYLGPYLGQACHVGMDINHRAGSSLLAPLDFDTQAWFNSLAMGHNNNRWRGIRRWPNGDVWALQTHHLIELLVPQNAPLQIGTRYATTAGVHVGSHEHTHFEFKVGRKNKQRPLAASNDPASIACPIDFDDDSAAAQNDPEVLHLDPWILFWQIFEDRKTQQGELQAVMQPLAPARTGEPVRFTAEAVGLDPEKSTAVYRWTFGDGGCGWGQTARHVFARPGFYPVTLIVEDGQRVAARTQHIAISGAALAEPVLALTADGEPAFRARPAATADVYGWPVKPLPHQLTFVARASRPVPSGKAVALQNLGGGQLASASVRVDGPADEPAWLTLARTGGGDQQLVQVAVDATGLAPGTYRAVVHIDCPGAINSPQPLTVALEVRSEPPVAEVTIDDRDDGFFATPYFWVGHRFSRCPRDRRGHAGFYLTNGGRAAAGEYARFTPDLAAGSYQVSFSEATPFVVAADSEFNVRVRHAGGQTMVRVRPANSRQIGRFDFAAGSDGFVEIQAAESRGLVLADAVTFRRD